MIGPFLFTIIQPLGNLSPRIRIIIRGRMNLRVHIPKIVNRKIARLHHKVFNQREDFLHKLSHKLTKEYSHIYIENLKVYQIIEKTKKNKPLRKSILDSGWYSFIRLSIEVVTLSINSSTVIWSVIIFIILYILYPNSFTSGHKGTI